MVEVFFEFGGFEGGRFWCFCLVFHLLAGKDLEPLRLREQKPLGLAVGGGLVVYISHEPLGLSLGFASYVII